MTWRIASGWLFKPAWRKANRNDRDMIVPTNSFYVAVEGVKDESELPERVKRKMKRAVQRVLREEFMQVL